ncbi:MAG: hypothetical protein JJU00_11060 [Opitutales bacterium]|nr:hypothetical protein [Opitutales bacterium]
MEASVLEAKNQLSKLLRRAEAGDAVFIRRGRNGPLFRIVPVGAERERTLVPDPRWKGRISYTDEAVWESEWKDTD